MEELKLMYDACCHAIGNDLGTKVRNNELAYARFVYFYNAKKMFPTISNQKIGSIAGGRDNATVIHGIKRYGELKGYSDFDAIRKKIEWELDNTTPKSNKTDTRQEREIRYLYANKARLEKQVEILNKRIANTEVEREILDMFNKIPTERLIHNALEWANKRLELQGEPITENQRNYIVFALRQQLTIPADSNLLCGSFDPDNSTSSTTKCKCGREKWEHPKAT